MADLRALLEGLGYEDVRTLLQSGNAVFTTSGGDPALELEGRIEAQIATQLRLDVKVLVRTAGELQRSISDNPFLTRDVRPKELYVTFVSSRPPADKIAQLDREQFAPDAFALGDRVIYERRPNGVLDSRLPDWQKVLGLTATARNWDTVTKLGALAAG